MNNIFCVVTLKYVTLKTIDNSEVLVSLLIYRHISMGH
jgi:hypothetical protein